MLTAKGLRLRLKFAKKMTREYSAGVWSKELTSHQDGRSLKYNRNPLASAKVCLQNMAYAIWPTFDSQCA